MLQSSPKHAPRAKPEVGDETVKAKTGHTWKEWYAVLDKAGAEAWDHKTIVAYLKDNHILSGWWQQTVTVGYERARGKRAVHETRSGFVAGKSKTISASVETVFAFWADGRKRKRWLDHPVTFFRPNATTKHCALPGMAGRSGSALGLRVKPTAGPP